MRMRHDGPSSPVQPDAKAVVAAAERRLAAGHFLVSAAPSIPAALTEWKTEGAAWLRPGLLFAAVTVPASIVRAAVGGYSPQSQDRRIHDALDGPVFFQPADFQGEGAFVALLPAGVARSWRVRSSVLHPSRALLLVPAPDRCEPDAEGPWWVRPPDGAGEFCSRPSVETLVHMGRHNVSRTDGDVR
ncbi:hypothetical protein ACGFW5_31595 [Streptomyces sp. NPDC048416]|uniref:hypothetical protein n=1 Tax=Streptomyces sp. NPDC048416 TaxID=3365546 RepID=UPI0037144B8D